MPSMDDAQWTAFMLHTGRKEGYGAAIATFTAMLQEWRIAHNRTAPNTEHIPSSRSSSSVSESGAAPAGVSAEARKQRSTLVATAEELFRLLDEDDCGSILTAATREALDADWGYALARVENEPDVLNSQDWVKLCLDAGRRDGAASLVATLRVICDGVKNAKALRHRSRGPVPRSPSPAPAQYTQPPLVLSPEQREAQRARNEWRAKHAPFVSSVTVGKTSVVVSQSVQNLLWRLPDETVPLHREVGPHVAARDEAAMAQLRAAVGELAHPHFVECARRVADAAHKEADVADVVLARVAALESLVAARERVLASRAAECAWGAARGASDAAGTAAVAVDHMCLALLRPASPSEAVRQRALAEHDVDNELYDLRYRAAAVAAPLASGGRFDARVVGLAALLARSSARIGTLEAAVSISLRGELAAQSRRLAMLEYRCELLDAAGGEGTARFLASPHHLSAFASMPSEKVVHATHASFDSTVVRAARRAADLNTGSSSGIRPPPAAARVPTRTTMVTTLRAKTPAAAQRWLEAMSGVGWSVASRGMAPGLRSHASPTGVRKVRFVLNRYILRESCSQFDSLPLTYLTISSIKSNRKGSTFHTPSIRFAPRTTRGDGDSMASVVCEGPLELQTMQAGGLKRVWEARPHCVLRSSGALVLTKRLLRATRRASNSTTLGRVQPGGARVDPLDPRMFHLERYADEEEWRAPRAAAFASPSAAAFTPQRVEKFIRVGRRYSTASSPVSAAPGGGGAAMLLASATPLPAVQTTVET
jgi:hypothetical protein